METQEIANSAPSTETELMPAISSASASYSCQTEVDTEGVINEIANFILIFEIVLLGGLIEMWELLTLRMYLDDKFKLEIVEYYSGSDLLVIRLIHPNGRCPIEVEITVSYEKGERDFSPSSAVMAHMLFHIKHRLLSSRDYVNGKTTIHYKTKSLTSKQPTSKAITATERDLHKTPTRGNDQDLLQIQLEELFEKKEKMPLSYDVTFNVRGRKFAAHKAIFAMRSPVLVAMFQHSKKEMLSGNVEVEDVDPDVFQEVLRYMYTGLTRSAAMDVMAPALLAAADKYLLDQLKTRCETHLIHQMSSQNCLDLLALTITHHPAEHLKKYAIEFFRRYPGDVMKSNEWKKMKEENPALLCDLMQMVFTPPTV